MLGGSDSVRPRPPIGGCTPSSGSTTVGGGGSCSTNISAALSSLLDSAAIMDWQTDNRKPWITFVDADTLLDPRYFAAVSEKIISLERDAAVPETKQTLQSIAGDERRNVLNAWTSPKGGAIGSSAGGTTTTPLLLSSGPLSADGGGPRQCPTVLPTAGLTGGPTEYLLHTGSLEDINSATRGSLRETSLHSLERSYNSGAFRFSHSSAGGPSSHQGHMMSTSSTPASVAWTIFQPPTLYLRHVDEHPLLSRFTSFFLSCCNVSGVGSRTLHSSPVTAHLRFWGKCGYARGAELLQRADFVAERELVLLRAADDHIVQEENISRASRQLLLSSSSRTQQGNHLALHESQKRSGGSFSPQGEISDEISPSTEPPVERQRLFSKDDFYAALRPVIIPVFYPALAPAVGSIPFFDCVHKCGTALKRHYLCLGYQCKLVSATQFSSGGAVVRCYAKLFFDSLFHWIVVLSTLTFVIGLVRCGELGEVLRGHLLARGPLRLAGPGLLHQPLMNAVGLLLVVLPPFTPFFVCMFLVLRLRKRWVYVFTGVRGGGGGSPEQGRAGSCGTRGAPGERPASSDAPSETKDTSRSGSRKERLQRKLGLLPKSDEGGLSSRGMSIDASAQPTNAAEEFVARSAPLLPQKHSNHVPLAAGEEETAVIAKNRGSSPLPAAAAQRINNLPPSSPSNYILNHLRSRPRVQDSGITFCDEADGRRRTAHYSSLLGWLTELVLGDGMASRPHGSFRPVPHQLPRSRICAVHVLLTVSKYSSWQKKFRRLFQPLP